MKEILETIDSRIKSPVFGYFITAFIAINWKPIFYLMIDNGNTESRIQYFESNTNILSLLVYPIVISVLFILIYPWVSYFLMYLSRKPTYLKNSLQAHSEHLLLIKRRELEEERTAFLSDTEKELIDRAKRDEELGNIKDEEVREKLKSEIDELRQERDKLRNSTEENIFKEVEKFNGGLTQEKQMRANRFITQSGHGNEAYKNFLEFSFPDIESGLIESYKAPDFDELCKHANVRLKLITEDDFREFFKKDKNLIAGKTHSLWNGTGIFSIEGEPSLIAFMKDNSLLVSQKALDDFRRVFTLFKAYVENQIPDNEIDVGITSDGIVPPNY